MLGKKVKSRITFLVILIISSVFIIFVILKSLEDNVVYFFSPTELLNKPITEIDQKIRLGGIVKKNSLVKNDKSIKFIITDLENEIFVSYTGLVPNLFAEGKGVVAEGKLKDKKYFIANTILAKHDENYMPPEVAKTLKKSNN